MYVIIMFWVITDLLVYEACWEICLQPAFRVFVFVVVCEATRLLNLIVFVVAREDHNRWMMANSSNVCGGLHSHRLQELWKGWIVPTAIHKVLPDQNAQFVANVVKDIFLVYSTAPYSVVISVGIQL